jgi:hypothetical protein
MPQPIPLEVRAAEWMSPKGRVFRSGERLNWYNREEVAQFVKDGFVRALPTMLIKVSVDCTDGISRALRPGAVAEVESDTAQRLLKERTGVTPHAVQSNESELAAWDKFLADEAAAEKAAADAALEDSVEKPKAEKPKAPAK